ncbi:hypothetical protein SAMN02745150_01021 [Brevinema andersonii]|uniref:Uncharacterized protein n=1 Tax=Brevinema andersonii TaxID=34097 RepID=A0A1I1EAP0_BREAD|nr:hypothetical protein [Brevinema andersonii]SFB83796.1 hypothetical protein SAMN02745150_01021 [Brevinema andersonii]
MNKIVCLLLFSLSVSCSLVKEEAFKLSYAERKVIDTFGKHELLSLEPNGYWNSQEYKTLLFNGDFLTMQSTIISGGKIVRVENYALEVIKDVSKFEGIYRIHGSGAYSGLYMGIYAETNSTGSLVKVEVGLSENGILDKARTKNNWDYASDLIVNRVFKVFHSEKIVKLNNDLKYDVKETTNAIFSINRVTGELRAEFTEVKPVTRSRRDVSTTASRTILTSLGNIQAQSVQILGPNLEVYRLASGGYFAVEYRTDPVFGKLRMKFAQGLTKEEVLNKLSAISEYYWESEKTADIPNRVLEKIKDRPIVTLKAFNAPPIGASSSPIIIPDAYDWENTTEYRINIETMWAKIIDVNNKISNINDYRVRMIEDISDTEGVFQFLGTGLLNGQYAKLSITNVDKKAGWLVLSADKEKFEQQPVTNDIQDNFEAQQPHRVVIEMQQRGKTWVGVMDDGTYSKTATTNWSFDAEKLLIQAKILTNSVPKTSTYSFKIVSNESGEKGTFLLKTTAENFPNSENDTDMGSPFDNFYFAVQLGNGVNNGRALMEIGMEQHQVEYALKHRAVQNLYEQSVVPSTDKIVKALAGLTPWIKLKNGYYSETETEIWWFDSDTMEAVVMEITMSNGDVVTNASRFALEMSRDVGAIEGAFLLKPSENKTPITTDYPNSTGTEINTPFDAHKDKHMYVLTGTATTANRAYIGFGGTVDNAKTAKPTDAANYHTRADAPLSAEAIQSAVDNAKNKGHLYVKLAANATTAPGVVNPGLYVPYETEEVQFSTDPLQVTITTIKRNNTRTTNTYPLQIVKAENQSKAIFKYLGTGPLGLKFGGIAVQNAALSGIAPTGTYLVLTNEDTLEKANQSLDALINVNQWNYNLKSSEQLEDEYIKAERGPWVSVDVIGSSSVLEYVDRFYDNRNTTNIVFKPTDRKVELGIIIKGVASQSEYEYEVVYTNVTAKVSNIIVRLSGDGIYNGKYLGFSLIEENDATKTKSGKTAIGDTFDSTKTALDSAHTNFYKLSDVTPKNDILKRANGIKRNPPASINSIGNTVVKVDSKGIYNSEDTQEFLFDAEENTLTVLTIKGSDSKTHKYNIIFPKSASNLSTGNNTAELQSRFYLKSFENNNTDPLHKHFVEMKVEAGATPKKIRFAASSVSPSDALNQFNAMDGNPDQWNYLEKTSTAIDMRVVVNASGFSWTRLITNDNLYYYDPQNTETWTFNPAVKTVSIKTTTSGSSTEHNYRIGMKRSISPDEGVFVLASDTSGTYDGRIVFLSLGTSGNDKNANARILVSTSSGDEAAKIQEVENLNTLLKNSNHWNFREDTLAVNEAKAIVSAAKVAEWRSLEGNNGIYDQNNYVSLKFEGGTKSRYTRYTNIKIQVVGVVSGFVAMAAEDFGYKMHSDISDTRGIFQLIRGSSTQFTNKYMAIELGTAVSDRLMKVGFGDTPAAAQEALNRQVAWNYMDKKMAEADDRVVKEAIKRGSAVWVSHLLHPIVGNVANPAYTSKMVTNIVFNTTEKTVKVEYVTTVGQDSTIKENVYGYTMIEDESDIKGIFRLSGYGDFGNKFIAGELISKGETYENRGRIAVGIDVASAKSALAATNAAQEWNMLERNSLLLNAQVIDTAVSKGVLAGLDQARRLHDPQNTTNLQFAKNGVNMTFTYTEYINGVPRPDVYEIEMVNDRSTTDGIFLLKGTGLFRNKYARISFSGNGNNEVTLLIKDQADDLTNRNMNSDSTRLSFKAKTALQQDNGLLEKIIAQQPFVTLTDKKVYVPKDSGIVSFSKISATGTLAERVIMTVVTNGASYTYDVLQVSNDVVTADEATYFLKATSGAWKDQYLLLKTQDKSSSDIVSLRSGLGVDMQNMTNDFNSTGLSVGYTVAQFENAKWVRQSEFASDEVVQEIVRESSTMSITRGGFNDFRDTDQWTFDVPNRKITVKKGNTFTSGNVAGQTVAEDVYYFNIYHMDSTSLETGVSMNAYPNTVHNNRKVATYAYFKLDSDPLRKNYFFSMNYSVETNMAKTEALKQHAESQPIWRTYNLAMNPASVMTNLKTNRIWIATNSSGAIDTSKMGVQATNKNTFVYNEAPGGGYRNNLFLYYSTVNSSGNFTNTQDFYVPVIYQYNGASDSIIMLEQEARTRPNTKKNKFVAIQVGTGANSFTAKIAEGDTLFNAINARNQLTSWNYKVKSSVGANSAFRSAFGTSGSFKGSVAIDGGSPSYYVLKWLNASDMLVSVTTPGRRVYQYDIEVMEVTGSGANTEYTVKFHGLRDLGNKFGRFRFNSKSTKARFAVGSDEQKLNSAWTAQTSDNLTK